MKGRALFGLLEEPAMLMFCSSCQHYREARGICALDGDAVTDTHLCAEWREAEQPRKLAQVYRRRYISPLKADSLGHLFGPDMRCENRAPAHTRFGWAEEPCGVSWEQHQRNPTPCRWPHPEPQRLGKRPLPGRQAA